MSDGPTMPLSAAKVVILEALKDGLLNGGHRQDLDAALATTFAMTIRLHQAEADSFLSPIEVHLCVQHSLSMIERGCRYRLEVKPFLNHFVKTCSYIQPYEEATDECRANTHAVLREAWLQKQSVTVNEVQMLAIYQDLLEFSSLMLFVRDSDVGASSRFCCKIIESFQWLRCVELSVQECYIALCMMQIREGRGFDPAPHHVALPEVDFFEDPLRNGNAPLAFEILEVTRRPDDEPSYDGAAGLFESVDRDRKEVVLDWSGSIVVLAKYFVRRIERIRGVLTDPEIGLPDAMLDHRPELQERFDATTDGEVKPQLKGIAKSAVSICKELTESNKKAIGLQESLSQSQKACQKLKVDLSEAKKEMKSAKKARDDAEYDAK